MRPDVDRIRYRSTAELIVAFRQRLLLTQQELADRSGVARAQLARYELGVGEPSVTTLRRLLGELGWVLTFGLEPATAALDAQLAKPHDPSRLLGFAAIAAIEVAAKAAADGVAVVVSGEAAAVLQGVPASTDHVVVLLRPDHLRRFATVAAGLRRTLRESPDSDEVFELHHGTRTMEVRLTEVLPVSRGASLSPSTGSTRRSCRSSTWPVLLAPGLVEDLGGNVVALARRMGGLHGVISRTGSIP